MSRAFFVCVVAGLATPLTGLAQSTSTSTIKDAAAFFRKDTISKATGLLATTGKKYQLTFHIETFATVPKNSMAKVAKMDAKEKVVFFQEWGRQRLTELKSEGLHILLCRSPGYLQTTMGEDIQRLGFSNEDIDSMTAKYIAQANAKKIDDGLLDALRLVDDRLQYYKENPPKRAPLGERLANVKVEALAKSPAEARGVAWVKGNVYFGADGLLKSDAERRLTKILDVTPGGICHKANGNLLFGDNKSHAILELTEDGQVLVLADSYKGAKLRDLDAVTVDRNGNVYFTDSETASDEKPTGRIFRLRPEGEVTLLADKLTFTRGIVVDPGNRHLYVVESPSGKISRYELPTTAKPLGKAAEFYSLEDFRSQGCAFDNNGNLWIGGVSRKSSMGQIIVVSSTGKWLGSLSVPAKMVSSLTFGGPRQDELFIATSEPNGVFHAQVGVVGFSGHPGVKVKTLRKSPLKLLSEAVN